MKAALIALVISIAANILFGLGYLDQRDALTRARADLKTASEAATSCSENTERLETLAASRKRDADKARAEARAAARAGDQRADVILATPATVPGDDCQSASDRASAWLAGRPNP
jgi:multidrug resistance efflux pump